MSHHARTSPRSLAAPAPVVTRLVPRPSYDEVPPAVQGTLALDLDPRPVDVPPPTPVPAGRSRTPDTADRELRGWTGRFAQALVEVVGGHRPVTQLARWTSRDVFRDLERRAQLVARATTTAPDTPPLRSTIRSQVRSVHVSRPSTGVAEVSVHVRHGDRSRALALRLDLVEGRWVCTALEFS
jgi:hypothetical protein